MKTQKLNCRQAQWALYLLRFDFTLKYVLETKIGKADRLSRRLDWKVGVENDNENQKLTNKERIHSLAEVDIIKKTKIAR